MGFFDWLGNAVGTVWNGVKDVAGKVYSGVKSGVDWVADKVKPVVDVIGKAASYIPVVGAPIQTIANQVSSGIDTVKRGVGLVGDIGRNIGATVDRVFSRKDK